VPMLGAVLGVGLGFAYTKSFNVSDFEGYSGMLVFFTFMPLGRGITVDDASELFALWIEDVSATGSAAIDIPGCADFHAVGNPGFGSGRSANTRSVCLASVPFAATSKARM
jgi:hypothetical protein